MSETALFPLQTVIFPGGLLPLRIFEPRYLDMVSDCLRQQTEFGICAIESSGSSDTDKDAIPYQVGTLVKVVDFEELPDGLLGITVLGKQKFLMQTVTRQQDGLLLADVSVIPAEHDQQVPSQYQHLVKLYERILPDIQEHHGPEVMEQYQQADLQSASWLGGRLVEYLPLDLTFKQELLQSNDVLQRLQALDKAVKDFAA